LPPTVQDTNGRLEGGWRHTAAFEFGGEIDREDDLCQLALAVGPRPAVAAGPHHIGEVNWMNFTAASRLAGSRGQNRRVII
jgi:hypothetical protein